MGMGGNENSTVSHFRPQVADNRGAGTVSSQGGQTFLEKIRREAPKNFFSLPTLVFSLPTLDLIKWVGKDPTAIT